MDIITLNNLEEILSLMKTVFGSKAVANRHRQDINTYLLNINPSIFNTDASLAILGTGQLGTMILGKEA